MNKSVLVIVALLTVASCAWAREVTLAAGIFRFAATDYYYPNFYYEKGYRGDVTLRWGVNERHAVRLAAVGYPMDDNLFDAAAEYGFRAARRAGSWEFFVEPAAGFELTKLQYPAPYYPTIQHHFLPWARAGADVGVGATWGPAYVGAAWRGRVLQYVGPTLFRQFRTQPYHHPWLEARWAFTPRWTAVARGGWEFAGYYNEVFNTPASFDGPRPFAEVGFSHSW